MVQSFANRSSTILFEFLINSNVNNWILPANICYIVPLVFKKARKQIQFVDINVDTLVIDEDILYNEIARNKNKPVGLLLNNSYGIDYDFYNFISAIKRLNNKVTIIQDKCLCKPEIKFNLDINIDLVLYSTGYAKYCDLGYGGYGYSHIKFEKIFFDFNKDTQDSLLNLVKFEISNNQTISNRINIFSNWLDNKTFLNNTELYFYKIKNQLPIIQKHKKEINKIYTDNLPSEIQLKPEMQNWRFNILSNNKDIILKKLFEKKLFASNHYPDMSKYFNGIEAKNTTNNYNNIINLFNDNYINIEQAFQITKIINSNL